VCVCVCVCACVRVCTYLLALYSLDQLKNNQTSNRFRIVFDVITVHNNYSSKPFNFVSQIMRTRHCTMEVRKGRTTGTYIKHHTGLVAVSPPGSAIVYNIITDSEVIILDSHFGFLARACSMPNI